MKNKIYDLTNPQKSIWLTEQFYNGTSVNNICGTMIIDGKMDFSKLKKAIYTFVQDNDAFRLKFFYDKTELKQEVLSSVQFDIPLIELSNDADLLALEQRVVSTPFDINKSLFNFHMFRFSENKCGFMVCMHHLISDACTASLVANKIINIYTSLLKEEEISELATSYIDYINAENEYLSSKKFEKDKEYWNSVFETVPEIGNIPSIKQENKNSCQAKRKTFVLSKEEVENINTFCSKNKISAFNFFMALYAIYVGKVSGLDDFVLGTPILNRSTFVEKNTPGMFISTVPFRFNLTDSLSFIDFARKIASDSLGMFRHQKYPYQNILEDIRKKNPTQPNLYDILISYQNTRTNRNSSDVPYEVRWTFNNNVADSMQIHLFDMNDAGLLNISYDYRLDKYDEEDICDIHNRICYMIEQVLACDSLLIDDIKITTPKERDIILNEFNNTSLEYDTNKTVVDYFEEQVIKTPDNIALVCEYTEITYKKLNEEANKLAHYLKQNNVKNKDFVGIMVHRSPEMIIGLLAILKVGACYLPIDPEYPTDRILYMLQDSNCKTVLVHNDTYNLINDNYNKINISLDSSIYNSNEVENLNINIAPNDLIYTIYTSGSTGNPKGVMLTHQNINNFIIGEKQHIDFSENKVMVSVTTICFDIFALEIWCSLTSGMKVVLANDAEQMSPILLRELCKKHNVNMIQTTPSRFSTLLANTNSLDFLDDFTDIMVGGEPFPKLLLEKFHKYSKAKIFNMYGPTETTVWSTIKDLTNTSNITIGKPIANTTCYILDKNKNLLPPYVAGELYIGGDGVSNGYWKREELTNEKFISSPFKDNEIIYNTNDLAYFTKEGELVHLGRTDFQVKIRGYRIELEEIENKVIKFPNIVNCVVNPVDNASKLCAYYISDEEINISDLRNYLSQELPNYMVPNYFVKMESFPHTPNGKINKKALPLPEINTYKEIVSARNEFDKYIATELQKALNLDAISITDSFFDIGGDSLTAINLCTKISNEYNIDFMVRDIFDSPIIKDMSDKIASRSKVDTVTLTKVEEKPYYNVSSAQKRVYYASKMSGEDSTLYNMPGAIVFDKKPDINKLNVCFNKLIDRHSSLRTYFEIIDGDVYQKIDKSINFEVIEQASKNKTIDELSKEFVKPFDLSKAPLLRASLVNKNNSSILLFDMHHIISDGSSIYILAKELCDLYNDIELEPLSFTYIDYTYYMNDLISNNKLDDSKNYWNSILKDNIPTLVLPYDKKRPTLKSSKGAKVYSKISSDLKLKIEMLSKELNVSNYMILLANYYILLNKYSNEQDIIIGTPVLGRDKKEFSNVIGMFVNTLPIRTKIDNNISFIEFLDTIKENCINAFEHQLYPFDEIVKNTNFKRDASRNPLFDVMFSYQNNGIASIDFDNFETTLSVFNTNISKFDLSLEVIPNSDTFDLNYEYCTDLFEKETIEHFAEQYNKILNIVLENISILIKDIDILSPDEKEKLNLIDNKSTIKEWILRFPNIQDVYIREIIDSQHRPILIAYLVADDHIPITNLRSFMHKNLPSNMVPTHFIIVDNINYLQNGIVDEDILPLPNTITLNKEVTYYPPRTTLELKIANIFQKILGISPISIKDSFFDLGGDSLMAMTLQIELMKISKNITYSDIFIYTTVEELANKIEQFIASSSHTSNIDFSHLNHILKQNLIIDSNIKNEKIGNVLITGTTGFLGAHILQEYLNTTPEGTAYCLIRPEPGLTLENKLLKKLHFYFGNQYDDLIGNRIIIVNGDITKDNFGLSENELSNLSKNINCVINSAAKVSHYGDYSIFKNINVVGTQNVAKFCKTFDKRLYHISTLSISGNAFMGQAYVENNTTENITFRENNFFINQSLENVYVRSKFEAEKYVLEEIANGLNAYILRIGNLMPRISDGKFQSNAGENAYANRLLSFGKLGMIPDYLLKDYAEFTPVDTCAQAIIKLIENPSEINRIFHLFNHNHVTVSELLDTFNKFLSIKIVSNEHFLEQIDMILNRENSDELLSGILGDFDKDRKLVYDSNIKLNSDFTIKYLENIGFKWPNISKEYLTEFFKLLYKEEN